MIGITVAGRFGNTDNGSAFFQVADNASPLRRQIFFKIGVLLHGVFRRLRTDCRRQRFFFGRFRLRRRRFIALVGVGVGFQPADKHLLLRVTFLGVRVVFVRVVANQSFFCAVACFCVGMLLDSACGNRSRYRRQNHGVGCGKHHQGGCRRKRTLDKPFDSCAALSLRLFMPIAVFH